MNPDLQEIAGQFGLTATSVSRANHAVLSQVYIINGAHILRSRTLYPDTVEKLEKEQKLLSYVRPVTQFLFPELLSARDGTNYFLHGELLWTAYPLINGEVPCTWLDLERFSDRARENSYRSLGQLHKDTTGVLSSIPFDSKLLQEVTEWMGEIPEEHLIPRHRERLVRAVDIVQKAEATYTEDDLCFVHGDYHVGNIVFQEENVVGLLDTDWCRKGSPLEDLSYTLMTHARDYRKASYAHNQQSFDAALAWYGLPKEKWKLFKEYLIIAVFCDLFLFCAFSELQDKPHLIPFQISFFEALVNEYS